jgi:hypothetical protein
MTLADDKKEDFYNNCKLALDAYNSEGTYVAAAKRLNIHSSTLAYRVSQAKRLDLVVEKEEDVTLPVFPDDDIPVEEILNTMEKRFEKRTEAAQAKRWFEIKLNTDEPVGINFVGDPHIDSNGCNIVLLRRDLKLMAQEGMYCVNLGDTTDGDWPGRLMKLHAQSDQSINTARRLADWFLNDTNLKWLAILIGNHDAWGEGAEILRRMNVQKIPMLDWTARFKVKFSNSKELKVIASHSFPGHSWINPLHSNQRREMVEEAHIYASGHKHDWGIAQSENGYREQCYTLLRARGYKFLDQYAENLGYPIQQQGATVCAVIDPKATSEARFVHCFADVSEAAEYLQWKRGRK